MCCLGIQRVGIRQAGKQHSQKHLGRVRAWHAAKRQAAARSGGIAAKRGVYFRSTARSASDFGKSRSFPRTLLRVSDGITIPP